MCHKTLKAFPVSQKNFAILQTGKKKLESLLELCVRGEASPQVQNDLLVKIQQKKLNEQEYYFCYLFSWRNSLHFYALV